MIRLFFLFITFTLTTNAWSQDSLFLLTYESYIDMVMENHPYAQRADITKQYGEASVLESRGAFDPKLVGNINQKYFDDKQYYSRAEGGLKIPTWYGVSVNSGYTLNDGVYLNPEQRVPSSGLWYAGLEVQLGKGMIMNERRATFEKAKIFREASDYERTIMLNELKRNASNSYWQWQQAYKEFSIYQQAHENARIRLDAVKESAIFGDRPFIDTVEASIALQNRNISMEKARNYLANAEIKLEMFLWTDDLIPLELENTRPDPTTTLSILPIQVVDSTLANHPMMALNKLMIDQREIELQLKREAWKPSFSLKYNAISAPINGNPMSEYSPANYTWGANFSYPIFSRKAMGGVRLAKLKLQDNKLKLKEKSNELNAKIQSLQNSYNLSLKQITTVNNLVYNNERLYESELTLFQLGESSIFMINSRENAWLKAKIEQVRLIAERNRVHSELQFILMNSL